MDEEKTLLGKIRKILGIELAEETTEAVTEEVVLEETSIKLETMKLADGSAEFEAVAFVPGEAVFIVNPDSGDRLPLPVGSYDMEDGKVLVVAEEGLISEVMDGAVEPEVEMETEFITKTDFEDFKNEIKSMLSKQTTDEVVKLSKEKEELQAKLDAVPDSKPIKHAPVDLSFTPTNKKERILAAIRNN